MTAKEEEGKFVLARLAVRRIPPEFPGRQRETRHFADQSDLSDQSDQSDLSDLSDQSDIRPIRQIRQIRPIRPIIKRLPPHR